VPEANSKLLAKFQPFFDKIKASTQTHKTWWIGGGCAAGAVIVVGALYLGGAFGPSGKQICTTGLTLAKDYGVISPSAKLSGSAKSADVHDRRSCGASVGEEVYTLMVDLKSEDFEHRKCHDVLKQTGCIRLYSVARNDGMTTYQVREIPPDQSDEAIEAKEGGPKPAGNAPAPGAAAAPGDAGGGDLDTETAVDNSGSAPATSVAPAPAAPAAPQQ
jgi:hypothetical protein